MDTPELWLDWKPPSAREQKSGTDKTDKTSIGGRGLIAELFQHTEGPAPETAQGSPDAGEDNAPTEGQTAALALMNASGSRIVTLEDGPVIGVWSDLDSPEIRAALRTLGIQHPVKYLDGSDVPMKYKVRKVAGEPTPLSVLKEMEQHPEPWVIRDQMWKNTRPLTWREYEERCLGESKAAAEELQRKQKGGKTK